MMADVRSLLYGMRLLVAADERSLLGRFRHCSVLAIIT